MLSSLQPARPRKASSKDEKLVSQIMGAAYSQPWTHRHVAMALENNEVWLVGDKGFVIYELIAPEVEIKMMAVHPMAQRQGVGGLLVQSVIDNCTTKAMTKIFLEVEERNEAAIALYKKFGFSEFSKRQDYYGPYRHALLMELQLLPKPIN